MPKVFVWPNVRAFAILAVVFLVGAFVVVNAQSANFDMKLSTPAVTVDENGRTIVTMMASGDLPGAFTLALNTNPDGTVSGGEWALIVSHTVVIQDPGPVEPGGDPDGQREFLVQKGVLKGTVDSGTVHWNQDGSVTSITGVSLSVTGGTQEYEPATGGSGSANGYFLTDRDNADGTLALTF